MDGNNWKWEDLNITEEEVYGNVRVNPITGGHWHGGSYKHCEICPLKLNQCSPYTCPVLRQINDQRNGVYFRGISPYCVIQAFPSSDLFTSKSERKYL